MLLARRVKVHSRLPTESQQTRSAYGRCRIGCRDVVGHGINGIYAYKDDPLFPFPAIRFRENDREVMGLRSKEKGDWRLLSCEEKKTLYRASFCETYSEFLAPRGTWKLVVGYGLIVVSFGFWSMMFAHHYVNDVRPPSLAESSKRAQLRRMIEIRTNPIDGLTSHWNYETDKWKWQDPPPPPPDKKKK